MLQLAVIFSRLFQELQFANCLFIYPLGLRVKILGYSLRIRFTSDGSARQICVSSFSFAIKMGHLCKHLVKDIYRRGKFWKVSDCAIKYKISLFALLLCLRFDQASVWIRCHLREFLINLWSWLANEPSDDRVNVGTNLKQEHFIRLFERIFICFL